VQRACHSGDRGRWRQLVDLKSDEAISAGPNFPTSLPVSRPRRYRQNLRQEYRPEQRLFPPPPGCCSPLALKTRCMANFRVRFCVGHADALGTRRKRKSTVNCPSEFINIGTLSRLDAATVFPRRFHWSDANLTQSRVGGGGRPPTRTIFTSHDDDLRVKAAQEMRSVLLSPRSAVQHGHCLVPAPCCSRLRPPNSGEIASPEVAFG